MSVFDLPMTARPGKDAIAGQDELGRTVYRTVTGERYTMPERTEMPAPTMGQRFENLGGLASRAYENLSVQGAIDAAKGIGEGIVSGIVQGFTAPGRALSGEPVSLGDVMATAGMSQVGAAPLRAPAGALRSGAMGGGRPPVTFDDVARAMDEAIKRGGNFNVARQDASNIFGAGSERVRYTDPESGGTIEVVARPDGSASVLELEVPESSRGQGIGQKLQERVMQDFPEMGGQVSSKAAAKTAYRLGRRPPGKPDATLEEVFADIDEMSSVNMVSPAMQERFAPPVRNVQDIEGTLQAKYPDVKLSISGSTERGYTLNKIDVPKDKRESGIGTAVMNDLVTLADQQGAVLKLSPSGDFGGSVPRLKDFYERFGFVQNKGKNTDYAISESMYRSPALIPPSQWESLVVGK
jgi:predicted GNAT family acetyltransferase